MATSNPGSPRCARRATGWLRTSSCGSSSPATPFPDLERWAAPVLERSELCAIDLSGDDGAQPIAAFRGICRAARRRGLRLKAHVGEWGDADSVKEAVETLDLDEVQHGISAVRSPAVLRWLADHRIQLNLCPTSNVMLGRVPRLEDHPIRRLVDAGVPVTINTDDVLVCGSGFSDELLSVFRAGLLGAREFDRIRRRGLTSRGRDDAAGDRGPVGAGLVVRWVKGGVEQRRPLR